MLCIKDVYKAIIFHCTDFSSLYYNKMKKQKLSLSRNSSKVQYKILERDKIDTPSTHTRPVNFLAWYRHFNTKVGGLSQLYVLSIPYESTIRQLTVRFQSLNILQWCRIYIIWDPTHVSKNSRNWSLFINA
jgi:hypothetical protein